MHSGGKGQGLQRRAGEDSERGDGWRLEEVKLAASRALPPGHVGTGPWPLPLPRCHPYVTDFILNGGSGT